MAKFTGEWLLALGSALDYVNKIATTNISQITIVEQNNKTYMRCVYADGSGHVDLELKNLLTNDKYNWVTQHYDKFTFDNTTGLLSYDGDIIATKDTLVNGEHILITQDTDGKIKISVEDKKLLSIVDTLPNATIDLLDKYVINKQNNKTYRCIYNTTDNKYEWAYVGTDIPNIIEVVTTLPTASVDVLDKYVLLQTDDIIYKCVLNDDGITYEWIKITQEVNDVIKIITDITTIVPSIDNLGEYYLDTLDDKFWKVISVVDDIDPTIVTYSLEEVRKKQEIIIPIEDISTLTASADTVGIIYFDKATNKMYKGVMDDTDPTNVQYGFEDVTSKGISIYQDYGLLPVNTNAPTEPTIAYCIEEYMDATSNPIVTYKKGFYLYDVDNSEWVLISKDNELYPLFIPNHDYVKGDKFRDINDNKYKVINDYTSTTNVEDNKNDIIMVHEVYYSLTQEQHDNLVANGEITDLTRDIYIVVDAVIQGNIYFGTVNTTLTQETIDRGNYTVNSVNLDDDKIIFKYPKKWGELISITDGSGFNIVNAYVQTEEVIDGEDYYVYTLDEFTTLYDYNITFAFGEIETTQPIELSTIYYGTGKDGLNTVSIVKGDYEISGLTVDDDVIIYKYPTSWGLLSEIIDSSGFNLINAYVQTIETINSVDYYVYTLNELTTLFDYSVTFKL